MRTILYYNTNMNQYNIFLKAILPFPEVVLSYFNIYKII